LQTIQVPVVGATSEDTRNTNLGEAKRKQEHMTSIVRGPLAVVEDDESVRQSLLRLLHSSGRAAVAYASAEEFLFCLQRDTPCCLVLDIHLRGMSGIDLLEKLARENLRIPVVFITANGEEASEGVLRRSGATCLRKPFDETSLIQAIDAAIGELPAASAGPA
jgi:FixJ family two-component response regulator